MTGDARRAAASVDDQRREPLPRGAATPPAATSRAAGHLGEQHLLLGGQAVGGVPPQPGAEHLGRGLGVELHAPRRGREPQRLRAARRAASRAPLRRAGPRARRRRCSGSPAARRGRPATGRMPRHRSAAPEPARSCGRRGCAPPCRRGPPPRAGDPGRRRASGTPRATASAMRARVGASHGRDRVVAGAHGARRARPGRRGAGRRPSVDATGSPRSPRTTSSSSPSSVHHSPSHATGASGSCCTTSRRAISRAGCRRGHRCRR